MNHRFVWLATTVLGVAATASAQEISWKKIVLSDKFFSEGACAADFNKDGKMDVAAGPFWYEGPEFTKKRAIYAPTGKEAEGAYKADGQYSDCFVCYSYDFNHDGFPDYLVYGWPGKEARLYINPGKEIASDKPWVVHNVFDVVDNESPQLTDFDGDGKPEGIFHTSDAKILPDDGKKGGCLGWATIDWADATKKWKFNVVSPKGGWQRYTHGYGIGDLSGDGKNDILTNQEWWENPGSPGGAWKQHKVAFYTSGHGNGGAQIFAYDVDADGKNDVITSLQAHGCGLAWFKQGAKDDKGELTWTRNLIMPDKYEPNEQGIKFSQLHAVALEDINGDGLKDIITGKRFYAHNSKGDVAPGDPAVLYWFELKRSADKSVKWVGHQVDNDSGIGCQVAAYDLNGDGKLDIVVGNKKGCFVFLQK